MKIALGQTNIVWEDKQKNKLKYSELLLKAKESNVDLVAFPEMSLTGFTMNVNLLGEEQNSQDSSIEWFKNQAAANNIYIGFGYVEKINAQSKGKNNYCVVTPDGSILSLYSKIHPFSYGLESQFYTGGEKLGLFRIQDINIATLICYDLRFPEIFQIASRKADLIIVAANWPKARREHWITLLKARAIENQCFIAGINRVGIGDNIEYSGDSMLIDPLGNVLVQGTDKEELIIHDIDVNKVHEVRNNFRLKADRREELYLSLYKEAFSKE